MFHKKLKHFSFLFLFSSTAVRGIQAKRRLLHWLMGGIFILLLISDSTSVVPKRQNAAMSYVLKAAGALVPAVVIPPLEINPQDVLLL